MRLRTWLLAPFALTLLISGCAHFAPPPAKSEAAASSKSRFSQQGKASFYAHKHHGRRTANGERHDQHAMVAAHPSLPFGTRVRVTNLQNQKQVIVRINDRGPFVRGRIIDLSRAAAEGVGMIDKGIARVRIETLE